MTISRDTLKAMVRDYGGFPPTDEELDLIQPELDNYLAQVEKLRELDLSDVMSSRLLHAEERSQAREQY
jgi:hypothetical protein